MEGGSRRGGGPGLDTGSGGPQSTTPSWQRRGGPLSCQFLTEAGNPGFYVKSPVFKCWQMIYNYEKKKKKKTLHTSAYTYAVYELTQNTSEAR